MPELTPENILNAFKKKKINETLAVDYLDSFIENGEDEKLRVKSCEVLSELASNNTEVLKLFENLLVSDYNEKVRAISVKFIIKNFLNDKIGLIKWVIGHEKSGYCLLTILKELKKINTEKSLNLIEIMENKIGRKFIEKYGVEPSEGLALGILNTPNNYLVSFNDGVDGAERYIFFDTKDNHVIRIIGKEVFPNLEIISMLPYLKELKIKYTYTKDLKGLSNLKNLEVLELDAVDIDTIESIKEINSLKKLKELSVLFNDKIDHINFVSNLVNLEKLTITGGMDWEWFGKISEIEGLDLLINLRELKIIGNKITEIKGLKSLINLKILNLCGNKIYEIKGIENLVKLEVLDLRGNEIIEIKGLETLINLKKLYLYGNKIPEIEELEPIKWDSVKEPQKFVKYCRQKIS